MSTPQAPVADHKRFQLIVWILIVISIAIFGFLAFIPTSWEDPHDGPIQNILILKEWVPKLFMYLGTIAAFVLFVAAVLSFRRGKYLTGVGAVVCACGMPAAYFAFMVLNLSPWRVESERQSGSAEYAVLFKFSYHGHQWAMGRLENKGRFFTHYASLGTVKRTDPDSYVTLIYPKNSTATLYGNLIQAPNGLLLAVRDNCDCYMAYHPDSGKFFDSEAITLLSPFILLGPNDELTEHEVKRIKGAIEEHNEGKREVIPSKQAIEDGLKHANPKVRELCAKWLKLYP